MNRINFNNIKNVHLTGIKGVGMTALALYLTDMGIKVGGSDVSEVFVTDEILKKKGISYKLGIKKENVPSDCDLLITTAAHGGLNNVEAVYARKKNIKVITYAEALAMISLEKETICVCGVGGKTSISSMLAVVCDSAGLNPSYIVGVGNIFPIGVPGRYVREGRNFICESDEYVVSPGVDNRAKFNLLFPKVIVVTNIEYDHPDIYKNLDETENTFLQFFNKLHKFGYLIADSDNENTMSVAKKSKANLITYGFDKTADYFIKKIRHVDQKTKFDLYIKKNKILVKDISINLPGKYNVKNAVAAYAVGNLLGISEENLRKGLNRYLGCRRRFEQMPFYKGATFYDDYAHHPKEIENVIETTRQWFRKRRIIVIFQPHTYSRTKALLDQFSKSFNKADIVGIMDIYASAREKADPKLSSEVLVKAVKRHKDKVVYLKDHANTIKWIENNVNAKDIVLTLGAGDIFHLYDKIKKKGN